jgi:antibiotic biosynthesis monooxygenase (ABM) superfamily enzyme
VVSTPAAPPTAAPVTVITQTRVRADGTAYFGRWQQQVTDVVARYPGFLDHQVIPPNPPTQIDWVIIQKFASADAARTWLQSDDRLRLVETARPMLVGHDDIHLIEDDNAGQPPAAVSAVISMRIAPGQEETYRAWGQRIAAAQAKFPGFQGFKINPPIPGLQDDWVTILTFDTQPHLDAWLTSPARRKLLAEAAAFTTESHYRTVRSGFAQWFRVQGGAPQPPAWKQNMLVLLALYPVVFLFGFFVQNPLLRDRAGFPFWLSLFVANATGVVILNRLVPWVSRRFGWWLTPTAPDPTRVTLTGAALVALLYALWLLAFSRFP